MREECGTNREDFEAAARRDVTAQPCLDTEGPTITTGSVKGT